MQARTLRQAAALVVLVFAAGPAAAQNAGSDWLIVPGVGIGAVRLGMPVADALRIAGPTQDAYSQGVGPATGGRLYYWFTTQGSRTAQTNDGGRVGTLGVFGDPEFATPGGLRVGSTPADVEQAMGAPSRVSRDDAQDRTQFIYDGSGIAFVVGGDPARVAGILVFEPGTRGTP
ncbi:MAG TPA: hypothetical protein VKZ50_14335 [bacterium]|nr:hypothetical protein [bacterium]